MNLRMPMDAQWAHYPSPVRSCEIWEGPHGSPIPGFGACPIMRLESSGEWMPTRRSYQIAVSAWWTKGEHGITGWWMLVVLDLPLWKIWYSQLGWWNSQLNGKTKQCSKPPTRYNMWQPSAHGSTVWMNRGEHCGWFASNKSKCQENSRASGNLQKICWI